MNKLLTAVISTTMALLGYYIIDNVSTSDVSFKQNTLAAATVPKLNVTTPRITIDPVTIETVITDTIVVHDTVAVTNTKYVKVPVTKHTTDTVYVPTENLQNITTESVKNKSPGDCISQPVDVELTIDGKMVYSSKPATDEP